MKSIFHHPDNKELLHSHVLTVRWMVCYWAHHLITVTKINTITIIIELKKVDGMQLEQNVDPL